MVSLCVLAACFTLLIEKEHGFPAVFSLSVSLYGLPVFGVCILEPC